MNKTQKKRITRKSRERELIKKLLSIGGKKVNIQYEEKSELERMLNDGKHFKERIIIHKGEPSQCHYNIARYYECQPDTGRVWHHFKICTGYALSDDGLWEQHSWGIKRNHLRIVESTIKRKAYYGYTLTPEESEEFCYSN